MTDSHAHLLPFHAINDFMLADYRQQVIQETLSSLANVSDGARAAVERTTRRYVAVPGFRNAAKAPVGVRIRPTIKAFEKHPDLVAAILSAWGELHAYLRQQLYDLLVERGWEVFPPDTERSKLPGFFPTWPAGEDFDKINAAYTEKFPDNEQPANHISLMTVWVSMRLPYDQPAESEPGEPAT
jgi:hypothetical protein